MALITCQDASFSYEGNIAVSGLDFEVHSGDYLCIVGENGSGKSTLIRGLLRQKAPSSGSIRTGDGLKANEMGYLPQQTAAQKDFPASAYEVVLSGRLSQRGIRPFYSKEDRAAAAENISRLGIAGLRNRCYRELSGGQQQRVLLARALCATKKILLLDEPVAGLDPVVTQELYREIERINREEGLTVIMVSHDIGSAVKYASHILHLQNKQVFFGTAEQYAASGAGAGFIGANKQEAKRRVACKQGGERHD
ncbi:MAG: metal ABC transporter ATP-binding protein [Clostridiales Family XIII bacterium]|jgi:zinc transport system ATP-binding protein|nr:metal ABC transporter ATP-binding protein [Clostridiales Family XIII bacterium]